MNLPPSPAINRSPRPSIDRTQAAATVLDALARQRITLTWEDNQLRIISPYPTISPALQGTIKAYYPELSALVQASLGITPVHAAIPSLPSPPDPTPVMPPSLPPAAPAPAPVESILATDTSWEPGQWIEWQSNVFGLCQGEILERVAPNLLRIREHPITRETVLIPLTWTPKPIMPPTDPTAARWTPAFILEG